MAKAKAKTKTSTPSPAQLRARRKFAAMAKARAKAAKVAKRAANATLRKSRTSAKKTTKRNYTTLGPVRIGGKSFPAGTTFPKQRYTLQAGGRTMMFATKAEAETFGKSIAAQTGRAVKVRKEELNKNGVTYRNAGGFTIKSNGRRKNAETRSAAHPIEVKKHFRAGGPGYKSQWQRAHEAGQKQLFQVKNGKKRNSTSTAKAAYTEFTGKPARKLTTMYAPKGSGAHGTLAAMGKLKKLYIKGRTPLDFKGGPKAPTLARDPKTNQMFVLGKNYRLQLPRKNPSGMEDLGEITRIEYEAEKVHLGDKGTVTYFHKMGEEGGKKPHCLVNSEGLIVISGGDYRITARGIEN